MAENKTVKIHVENLKKDFEHLKVLQGITTDIEEGEVVVVIGPSGSGKSTFLRCLNRLEDITEGTVVVDGFNIADKHTDINRVRENIGMVFQHFNLFNNMNVLRNLMLAPIDLKKADKATARAEALRMLEKVGLSDKADAFPSQLSGGQKQRVSIARALLKDAPIILLDDCTSALDYETEREITENLYRDYGDRTTIISSHRAGSVAHCDEILYFEDGEIVERGTHAELMALKGRYCEIFTEQEALKEEELG